ncbi:MAG: hypothetical protein IKI72_05465 [Bacteroidales bacterium]|nr:hypothetical protein [Bacteroidales bacterium]
MCWLIGNPAWIGVIIAALSLVVSIWSVIFKNNSNKRVEEYNNSCIRLKNRPVIEMENGWMAKPTASSITFNLIAKHNEACITKIVPLTESYICTQPRSFPINMSAGNVELVNFVCCRPEIFDTAILSIDIYYEDIIGTLYKTHIEGTQSRLRVIPAQCVIPSHC